MKRLYLVTGAYGHLGHTIVDELLARGEEVRGLALPGDSIPAPVRRGLEICQGDVCDPDSLVAFFHVDEPREIVVIHTAGIVSIASKFNQKVFDVNVVGTKNIVDICRKSNVRRLVHVSSVHAIPEKARGSITVRWKACTPKPRPRPRRSSSTPRPAGWMPWWFILQASWGRGITATGISPSSLPIT